MIPQVIEVPSPLGLRPSGLEDAPDALRRAGLHERLGSPDAVRIDVPPYGDVRDPETGILNPQGSRRSPATSPVPWMPRSTPAGRHGRPRRTERESACLCPPGR